MKKLTIILGILIITGCTRHQSYSGNGEYTELTTRNVIYRDLTRPVSIDNNSTVSKSDDFTAPQLIK